MGADCLLSQASFSFFCVNHLYCCMTEWCQWSTSPGEYTRDQMHVKFMTKTVCTHKDWIELMHSFLWIHKSVWTYDSLLFPTCTNLIKNSHFYPFYTHLICYLHIKTLFVLQLKGHNNNNSKEAAQLYWVQNWNPDWFIQNLFNFLLFLLQILLCFNKLHVPFNCFISNQVYMHVKLHVLNEVAFCL